MEGAIFMHLKRRMLVLLMIILGTITALAAAQEAAGAMGEGTENRNWVTGAESPPELMSPLEYNFTVEQAQIPVDEDVNLSARVFRPILPGEEPGPCVVFADGYGVPSYVGGITGIGAMASLADLAQRGYAGVYVTLRTANVPADEAFYFQYAEDGYEIVEWMAEQEWCNGNVGMIGASLNGISQWLTAQQLPPHLKAIVPTIGCGDCYWYLWYKGGMLPGAGRERRVPPLTAYDEFAAAIQHRNYDDWWRARDTETADHLAIAESGIAVLQCGGWDDYIFAGGMRAVEEITAAGGEGMHIIGPCSHGGLMPTLEPYGIEAFTVLWFDHFLKGIDNGIAEGPMALFYVQGPDQYRFEDVWPIPDTRTARLHLREQVSGSAVSINDGSLTAGPPQPGEAGMNYVYSPEGPYNAAGGAGPRLREDQRPDEAHSLTWTTDPLEAPTEVTGWPSLNFWASATAPDTDFVVEITDVAPDGTSTQVARGWLNAQRYFDRSNPEPLVPGQIYQFEAELWPISYVFQPGHRIRVALSGSDFPSAAPNPHPATVTIYQDADHPSYLELPVIGTAKLPTEW